MSTDISKTTRKYAYQLIVIQSGVVLLVAIVFLMWHGVVAGKSALYGGLAWVIPSLGFARWVFAKTSPRATKQIMVNFMLAECAKLILAGVLFVVIAKYASVVYLPLVAGFAAALVAVWVAPLVLMKTWVNT